MAGPAGWPEAVMPIFQTDAPVVLVQGLATVRDADLQTNSDRYVRLALAKAPEMFRGNRGSCCAASTSTSPASGSR